MSATNLLPCPFCGGDAVFITPHNGGNPYVMCEKNHCTQPNPDAIAAWNHRTTQPDPRDEVIAALVDALHAIELWDAARGYPIPYRHRDPMRAALAAAKAVVK